MILNWFNGSFRPFGTFFISWGWLRTVVGTPPLSTWPSTSCQPSSSPSSSTSPRWRSSWWAWYGCVENWAKMFKIIHQSIETPFKFFETELVWIKMKDDANNTVRKTNKHTNLVNIEIYILHVCKYMIWYMPYGLLNVILTKLNIIQPKLLADVNLARRYWFVWNYQLKFKNSNECLIRIRLNWK